jgi:hypothetical protein
MSTDFKGITQAYRASSEYKQWFSAIQNEHSHLPGLIIDQCILAYKMNPQLYSTILKQEKMEERMKKNQIKNELIKKTSVILEEEVTIDEK